MLHANIHSESETWLLKNLLKGQDGEEEDQQALSKKFGHLNNYLRKGAEFPSSQPKSHPSRSQAHCATHEYAKVVLP